MIYELMFFLIETKALCDMQRSAAASCGSLQAYTCGAAERPPQQPAVSSSVQVHSNTTDLGAIAMAASRGEGFVRLGAGGLEKWGVGGKA